VKLVISRGSVALGPPAYCTGPKRARPAMPVVLVGTPSMDLERKLTSST
jgi:hypothetical protein